MAKIIIDIQDDVYRVLKEDIYPIPDTERLALVFKTLVKKGTPLPDHATNGDVIRAMFPSLDNSATYDTGVVRIFNPFDKMADIATNTDWLHRAYKDGDTDGNS